MAKNKRYSFTSEQAGLLFFAMVCAGVAIFLVITAHRSADIVDRSVYIEAEVTDVTEPVMRVTYHSKSRAGTKPSYSVEIYQDVEIVYSVGESGIFSDGSDIFVLDVQGTCQSWI